jgi:hypothetical protein
MLFKNKAPRSNLNNWRCVMLMDAAAKIISAIIAMRLTAVIV